VEDACLGAGEGEAEGEGGALPSAPRPLSPLRQYLPPGASPLPPGLLKGLAGPGGAPPVPPGGAVAVALLLPRLGRGGGAEGAGGAGGAGGEGPRGALLADCGLVACLCRVGIKCGTVH
jgi:hypothetical protein